MNIINDDVLRTILTSDHHSKVSSIRIVDWSVDENFVKAGNNYSTQVSRLTVRYRPQDQDDHSSPKEKTFFLKVPSNAPLYELVKKLGSYENEVAIYTSILPQMYGIEDDDEYFTPRQYYFDDNMSLVLEDLSQSGYRCADRVEQLDVEHCFYALRALAKFHALSVKLESTIGLPEFVKHDPFLNSEKQDENSVAFMSQCLVFVDNLPQNLKDQYPDMVAYFRNLASPETWTKMADDLSGKKFNVLNHGDFWTNNIMFKYDKYGTIEKVKLIDFQLTVWRTPAKDLIYFIITSVKFEVYVKYFPLLLKIYLDTLNRVLRRLDCPTYEMGDLLCDIDTMYPFALIVLCCVLPIIISDPEDPVDTKELCNEDKFELNGMAKTYQQKHFQDISVKWFEHFALKGTLRIDE